MHLQRIAAGVDKYSDILYVCGDVAEYTHMDNPIIKAFGSSADAPICALTGDDEYMLNRAHHDDACCDDSPTRSAGDAPNADSVRLAAYRARKRITYLVNTNRLYNLCTLTMAVEHIRYRAGEASFILVPLPLQHEREHVIGLWAKFVRRAKKYGGLSRYVATIEQHGGKKDADKTVKAGTYHIHYVTDTYITKQTLQELWTHGLCNFSPRVDRQGAPLTDLGNDLGKPVSNVGLYISKYIGKDADLSLYNKRRYWTSKGLAQPIKLTGAPACNELKLGWEAWGDVWKGKEESVSQGILKRTYKRRGLL